MAKQRLEIDPITLKDAAAKVTAAAKGHPEAKESKTAQVKLIDRTLKHPPARLVSAVAKDVFKSKISEAYVSNIRATAKGKKPKSKMVKLPRTTAQRVRLATKHGSDVISTAVALIRDAGGLDEARAILDQLSPLCK